MAYDSDYTLFGYSPAMLHATLATTIFVLSVAHIVTAFVHDWKGKGAFISAIINGHRYFHYENTDFAGKTKTAETPVIHVSADSGKNIKE